MPRTESSSAVSQDYFVLVLPILGYNPSRLGPLDPNEWMGQGHKLLGPTIIVSDNKKAHLKLSWDSKFVGSAVSGG